MSLRITAGSLAILLSTFATTSARADAIIIDDPQGAIQLASYLDDADGPIDATVDPVPAGAVPYAAPQGYAPPPMMAAPHCGPNVYPRLNAPMYPSPVQHTPTWNGGTFITNQAFAPHEMTYPHRYHAMYPPFYHKVKGRWIVTPFGVRQHEDWKLEGTEVIVNYRSSYKLFGGFHPPRH
ncbi:MAG: hypothetical protein R3B90_02075 [Planctomycetaceae bacterium]